MGTVTAGPVGNLGVTATLRGGATAVAVGASEGCAPEAEEDAPPAGWLPPQATDRKTAPINARAAEAGRTVMRIP
jgi:hypothetical protein